MSYKQLNLGLRRPLVLAPMAGGPSTPALCVAAARAGALPFLPAGYLSADELKVNLDTLREAAVGPFGVNLFASAPRHAVDLDGYFRYREDLLAGSDIDAALLPESPIWSDDGFDEKVEVALASAARFVSFTFAQPPVETIRRLRAAGKLVVLHATSRPGIAAIAESEADVIALQGPGAGGHRAKVHGVDNDAEEPLSGLLEFAMSLSDKPIFAGGGVGEASDVLALLRAGATAVQVGTMFLNTDEAGTKATHRRALLQANTTI